MQGQEFISVARALLNRLDDPAFVRSAISRAYYGAFHYAKHALRRFDCPHTAANHKHPDKWQALSNAPVHKVKEAGQKLSDLYEQRRKADYDMGNGAVQRGRNGLEALANAEEIVEWLSLCEDRGIAQQVAQDLHQAGFS